MLISNIVELLKARVICCEDQLETDVHSACGADLMSDVLAFVKDQSALLTGLVNPQVVRTADMMDIRCIIFVRGKEPDEQTVELARNRGIVILSTKYRLYTACGLLYVNGLVTDE